MRILVVEDDTRVARAVKRGLEAEGYAVDVAASGEDGHWLATENDYDALVLDVLLPGMGGLDLCRRLREAGDWTPVLVLTALDDPADEARALDGGADDFLGKPFSYVVLAARLRALLRRGRRHAAGRAGGRRPAPGPGPAPGLAGGDPGGADAAAVRAAGVLPPPPGRGAVQGDDPRARLGLRLRRARPTSWRSTSGSCGSGSTSRSAGTACRRCGWPATGSTRTVADVAVDRVRLRLTVVAAATTLVVLVVAGTVLVLAFARAQSEAADDLARARLAELAARAEQGRVPALLTDVGDDGFAQVVVDDRVLGASAGLRESPPVTGWRPRPGEPAVRDLEDVPDDDETEDYRTWATTVTGPDGPTTVYVGTAPEVVAESVRRLAVSLLVGLPLLLAVSTLLLWLLVGRVLRPVHESHRRQREFVADAAHELQSPLASYRAQLEVARLEVPREDRTEPWRATVRDLLAESDRMERLVRDLLFLSRDDERHRGPTTMVDLDDVVLEEVARLRPGTSTAIDTSAVTAAPVRGHRGDLGPDGAQPAGERSAARDRPGGGRVRGRPGRHRRADRLRRRSRDRTGAAGAGLRAVLARRHRPQRLREHRAGPLHRACRRRAPRRDRTRGRRAGGCAVRGPAARSVRRLGE